MYCRFPKEYFFSVEKEEKLIDFEELSNGILYRNIEEEDEETLERHCNKEKCNKESSCTCYEKKQCSSYDEGIAKSCKNEKKSKCEEELYKEKHKDEKHFFDTSDMEYSKEKEKECKCKKKK